VACHFSVANWSTTGCTIIHETSIPRCSFTLILVQYYFSTTHLRSYILMSKGSRPKIKYCSFPLPRPIRKKHRNPKKNYSLLYIDKT
jgi:hypothetical protein